MKKYFLIFRENLLCFSLYFCFFFCHWALLERTWVLLLYKTSFQVFIFINKTTLSCLSSKKTVLSVSAFPHGRDALLPSSSQWPFAELSLVAPYFCCLAAVVKQPFPFKNAFSDENIQLLHHKCVNSFYQPK